MVSNLHSRWTVAGATFVLWALLAASAVYWGLKFTARPAALPAMAAVRTPPPPDPVAVARLLGASPAAVAPVASLASRFSLIGVVASRSHGGAALISVDGRPAKPFRVGASVDEGLVLQSVEARKAVLGTGSDGPPALTLELPAQRK